MTKLSIDIEIIVLFFLYLILLNSELSECLDINHTETNLLWDDKIFFGGNLTAEIKTIANILEDINNTTTRNVKPKEKVNKPIIIDKTTNKNKVEQIKEMNYIKDNLSSKLSRKVSKKIRNLDNSKRIYYLPKPKIRGIDEVKSLLLENDIEDKMDGDIYFNNPYDNLVFIRNKTISLSGVDLFQEFIFDADSICRLSLQWFERYPKYISIMRTDQLKNRDNCVKPHLDSKPRGSFMNKWLNILKYLKTMRVDLNKYELNGKLLRKKITDDNTGTRYYHRNIMTELYLFNLLLMQLLMKLNHYIPYIVYFPNTGSLFDNKNKENYYKYDKEEDILKKLKKIDIYINEIPEEITNKLRTVISSCTNVMELISNYGISVNDTPKEIIFLYIQYKKIIRVLLNIYNHQDINNNNNQKRNIFNKNFVPNNVGFKPLEYHKKVEKSSDRFGFQFRYISKETLDKNNNVAESNLYNLIGNHILKNHLDLNNFSIADIRPNGLSGLLIYNQEYNEEKYYDCILKLEYNGNIKVINNNSLLLNEKITNWFKNNYINNKDYQFKMNNNISLQFKLLISCPYIVPKSNMRNNLSIIGDVYTLVYLIGKIKGDRDWKIVTEFNEITNDTNKQLSIVSKIIPNIKNQIKDNMCLMQTHNLKLEHLRKSKNVIIKEKNSGNELDDRSEYENSNIDKSIIRNCLNYIESGTIIEFNLLNENIKAICKNSEIIY